MPGAIRRTDYRRQSRYGTSPEEHLILEAVGTDEAITEMADLQNGWIPLRFGDERVVSTDVMPSKGRIDWVFWIAAESALDSESMEQVQTVKFQGARYEIVSAQFFAGSPAHWELMGIFTQQTPPVQ